MGKIVNRQDHSCCRFAFDIIQNIEIMSFLPAWSSRKTCLIETFYFQLQVVRDVMSSQGIMQWNVLCDDCVNPVEYHCNTCGDLLCTDCKTKHLARRKNKDHNVVPYSEKLALASKSTVCCKKHADKSYELFCKVCGVLVCTSCVTGDHQGHAFTQISEVYADVKTRLTSELDDMEKSLVPALEKRQNFEQSKTKDYLAALNVIDAGLRGAAKVLHDEINDALAKKLAHLELMKKKQMPDLQKRETDVEKMILDAKEAIKGHEDQLRKDDQVAMVLYATQRAMMPTLPVNTSISGISGYAPPTYTPGVIDRKSLDQQLGYIVEGKATLEKPLGGLHKHRERNLKSSEGTKSFEKLEPKKKTSKELPKFSPSPNLMKKHVVMAEFRADDRMPSLGIVCAGFGQAWVRSQIKVVQLMNTRGKTIRAVNARMSMNEDSNMAATSEGGLLICDPSSHCIRLVTKENEVLSFIKTGKSTPSCICTTTDDTIWVSMVADGAARLVCYDSVGLRKGIIEVKLHRFGCPTRMTANKVTGDLCFTESYSRVIAVRDDGIHVFTYAPEHDGVCLWDVCSDQLGNYLVADSGNNQVIVLDKTGTLIQMYGEFASPYGIDVDSDGRAWIAERGRGQGNSKVKMFRYQWHAIWINEFEHPSVLLFCLSPLLIHTLECLLVWIHVLINMDLDLEGKAHTYFVLTTDKRLFHTVFALNGKKELASRFILTNRYIDDLLSINSPEFENCSGQMYPAELEIKDTTESITTDSYLDLLLSIGNDSQLHSSIYDKREDFHITNFPFLSSNIPSSPAYGVFISLSLYDTPGLLLVWMYICILMTRRLSSKLLKHGYLAELLKSSFRKFYGRFGDLIQQYEVSLSRL